MKLRPNMNKIKLIPIIEAMMLLVILIIIAILVASNLNNKNINQAYTIAVDQIVSAAKDYAIDNYNLLPAKGETIYITLATLIDNQYFTNETNPKTKQLFDLKA